MADTIVATKAQAFATLGDRSVAKITDALELAANRKFKKLVTSSIYYQYSNAVVPEDISAITFGEKTIITIASSNYRSTGTFVAMSGITDVGLWAFNGRHEIEAIDDTSFYVDIDTSAFVGTAYTSGGTVCEFIRTELEDAEAYILLSDLIIASIDITKGDVGVIPNSSNFTQENTTKNSIENIYKLAGGFFKKAKDLIEANVGDGDGYHGMMIISSS